MKYQEMHLQVFRLRAAISCAMCAEMYDLFLKDDPNNQEYIAGKLSSEQEYDDLIHKIFANHILKQKKLQHELTHE